MAISKQMIKNSMNSNMVGKNIMMGSDLLGWKTLLGIWALAEFVFAAETTAPDNQWPFWAIAGIVFIALLAATSQEKSLAHTQFKVLSIIHLMGVVASTIATTFGMDLNEYMPIQLSRSWRSEAALLWAGGAFIEWALSVENWVTFFFPTSPLKKNKWEVIDEEISSKPKLRLIPVPPNFGKRPSKTEAWKAKAAEAAKQKALEAKKAKKEAALAELPSQKYAPKNLKKEKPEPPFVFNPADRRSTLLVAYLPRAATEEEVNAVFAEFGEVISFKLMVNPETKESRCFGFLKFKLPEACQKALHKVQQSKVIMAQKDSGYIWYLKAEYAANETMQTETGPRRASDPAGQTTEKTRPVARRATA